MTEQSAGHLFIINGDLTRLDCDALLVPTDSVLTVEEPWLSFTGEVTGRTKHVAERLFELSGTVEGRRIWLADVGGYEASAAWYVDAVVSFVAAASSALSDDPLRRNGLPPRLGVPVVGTRFGGAIDDKGLIFTELVRRLDKAVLEHSVDLVLVTFGAKPYAAAQRARHRLHAAGGYEAWESLGELRTEAERLARHALASELVLFIGAGVSMSAGVPSWQMLLDGLVERVVEIHGASVLSAQDRLRLQGMDVRDQADIIRKCFGDDDLYEAAIVELLRSEGYSLAHGLLASLKTHESITTNFDTLFEQASKIDGRDLVVLPFERVRSGIDWLLKLHGSVDRAGTMVLTRGDYLGLSERSGALFGILQAMLLTRHLVFVGYSLRDEPFHEVMHEVRRAVARTATDEEPPADGYSFGDRVGSVLLLENDELLAKLWQQDLHVLGMQPPIPDTGDKEARQRYQAAAARRLDLFLDLLVFRAADVSAFLLDHTYRSLLDDEERDLADGLTTAAKIAASGRGPIAQRVRALIGQLGWEDSTHQLDESRLGSDLS